MTLTQDVQQVYEEALDSLIEKVKQDSYILAALLVGSMSHDVVWSKSDIDLFLVTQETRLKAESFSLVENGVNIHACLAPRSKFRKMLEGSVQSSFMHSLLTKGRLLYSHDETIVELFENRHRLGTRDQEIQLLRNALWIPPMLAKAEKWLYVRRDTHYCFFWIMKCVDQLASIEALLHGEITGREVVQQALRLNPEFFHAIYTDLIDGEKTPETLQQALDHIHTYLYDKIHLLFAPVLAYLAESGGARSATEINIYFTGQMNLAGVENICEWLADENILRKVSTPLRLTEKSRIDVEEAAYYYEGDAR